MSHVAKCLEPFGTSVFAEMTSLADEHQAINLSQGFPDFEGPAEIREAAVEALRAGYNQYARSMGHPMLVEAIADNLRRHYRMGFDPLTEISVFCGATEGIASSLLGLLDPGDEVVLFEPFYDSYPALVARAGATARYLTLRFPDFELDLDELNAVVSDRTRVIVLNTPHNPTGKVFTRSELEGIAEVCQRHDIVCLTDEVYEHITFDEAEHVPMASIPGMRERTLTLSSTGKTYGFTGWKVGWAVGPAELVAAAQAAHQFITFCAPAPLQVAMSIAITDFNEDYYPQLQSEYQSRRDLLCDALEAARFDISRPRGTYFVLAAFGALSEDDDRAFARRLVAQHGVAAIPPSAFYASDRDEGRKLLRFAFCKKRSTLAAAAERLKEIGR